MLRYGGECRQARRRIRNSTGPDAKRDRHSESRCTPAKPGGATPGSSTRIKVILMASLANTGPSAGARWTLAALLRRLQPPPRARRIDAVAIGEIAESDPPVLRAPRHYPQKRASFIESAAMSREMYRL